LRATAWASWATRLPARIPAGRPLPGDATRSASVAA